MPNLSIIYCITFAISIFIQEKVGCNGHEPLSPDHLPSSTTTSPVQISQIGNAVTALPGSAIQKLLGDDPDGTLLLRPLLRDQTYQDADPNSDERQHHDTVRYEIVSLRKSPSHRHLTLELVRSSKEWFSPHYTELVYGPGGNVTVYSRSRKHDIRREHVRNTTSQPVDIYANNVHYSREPLHPTDCFYEGTIHVDTSWVVLNDCHEAGHFSGMVHDGTVVWLVEPAEPTNRNQRPEQMVVGIAHKFVADHDSHLTPNKLAPANFTHSHDNDPDSNHLNRLRRSIFQDSLLRHEFQTVENLKRSRRDLKLSQYHGPSPLIIEMYIVNDHSQYLRWDQNERTVISRTLEIAHILNAMFKQINIFVALVGTEVWKDKDHIVISKDGDETLKNFNTYRQTVILPRTPHDNAQLLTAPTTSREKSVSFSATYFKGGVVGKAIKRQICAYSDSTGVAMDHNKLIGPVASTMAHELGHSLGMDHDTEICKCPDKSCIMTPASGAFVPIRWSSCSLEYLEYSIAQGMDACLNNKPARVYDTPFCGNGFVEEGEECDCGLAQFCETKCCDPNTCKLTVNSTCATGACCNFFTCQPKPRASLCRTSRGTCDLPEYCNGRSEFCPSDLYIQNGQECMETYRAKEPEYHPVFSTPHYTRPATDKVSATNTLQSRTAREEDGYDTYAKAYCFNGKCNSYESQCKLLWGPTGRMSGGICYQQNVKGSVHNGDCGYSIKYDRYKPCPSNDYMCGRLHCTSEAEKVTYGDTSGRREGHSYIRFGRDKFYSCHSVFIDLGLDTPDAGMVPDGSSCGLDKICVNTSCVPKANIGIKPCHKNCHGNGVCNSNNNCHCNTGYGPPYCDKPGAGGSKDSGPAANIKRVKTWIVALLIFFFCAIPCICLLLFFLHQCTPFFKSSSTINNKRSNTYGKTNRCSILDLLPCLNYSYFESKKQKFKHSSANDTTGKQISSPAKGPTKIKEPKKSSNKFAPTTNRGLTNDHIQHVSLNQQQLLSAWPRSDISMGPTPSTCQDPQAVTHTSGVKKSLQKTHTTGTRKLPNYHQQQPPPSMLIDLPHLIAANPIDKLANKYQSSNLPIIQPIRPAPAPPATVINLVTATSNDIDRSDMFIVRKQNIPTHKVLPTLKDPAVANVFTALQLNPKNSDNPDASRGDRPVRSTSSATARHQPGRGKRQRSVKRSESAVRPNTQPPQPPSNSNNTHPDTGWLRVEVDEDNNPLETSPLNTFGPSSNNDIDQTGHLYQNLGSYPSPPPPPPPHTSSQPSLPLPIPPRMNAPPSLRQNTVAEEPWHHPQPKAFTGPKRTESAVSKLAKRFESGRAGSLNDAPTGNDP